MIKFFRFSWSKNKIIAVLCIISVLCILLRLLPLFMNTNLSPYLRVQPDDPLYNIRLLLLSIQHYPSYSWFDPMMFYPTGYTIQWGPAFTLISASFCILLGATTPETAITTALFVPVIMAGLMVPVVYLITKLFVDRTSSIYAGLIIAIFPLGYFIRSFYGYFDHHIAEVLFTSIFILLYLFALVYIQKCKLSSQYKKTILNTFLIGVLTGIMYLFGLMTITTVLLFPLIIVVFTLIQSVLSSIRGEPADFLFILNSSVFCTAAVGSILLGMRSGPFELATYTIAHPITYLLIVGYTGLLVLLNLIYLKKPSLKRAFLIVGIGSILSITVILTNLKLFSHYIASGMNFFISNPIMGTIVEMQGYIGPIELGFIILILVIVFIPGIVFSSQFRNFFRNISPQLLLFFIWLFIVTCLALLHQRYTYYLAVPLSVLYGLALSFIFLKLDISTQFDCNDNKGNFDPPKDQTDRYLSFGIIAIFLFFIPFFMFTADLNTLGVFSGPSINPDWQETLSWLRSNTPDPGINSTYIYEKESFNYPKNAYAILSWWDYGHAITVFSKRIATTNPFQLGVSGSNGVASFFTSTNESKAEKIVRNFGDKYIVTDVDMAFSKFDAIRTWAGENITYHSIINKSKISGINYPDSGFHLDMMVRNLQLLDGAGDLDLNISSLRHFRLIHESPTDINTIPLEYNPYGTSWNLLLQSISKNHHDIRYVKVFESVKGARIRGNGTISLSIHTNTGRQFLYITKSISGEFIVPYPTDWNKSGFKSANSYVINESGKKFLVKEEDVQLGNYIN